MNQHALEVLQHEAALDLVAGFASSPLGADRVRSLQPSDSIAIVADELDRVEQMMRLVEKATDWMIPAIPDCGSQLHRLATAGSVLAAPELLGLATLMQSSRSMRVALLASAAEAPLLASIADRLAKLPAPEDAIRRAVDDEGEVRDSASRELSRLRRGLRGARNRIVQRLEQYAASLPARYQVADASVTLREGRYVIPVRREGRSEVGGLVHDESATGQTLYVEPPIAIELMNQLRELEIAETREVQRILRELTDSLRPHQDALAASLDALVEVDCLHARARYALRFDGHRPTLLPRGTREYDIVNGRHPLLLAGTAEVVPFDLRLEPGERTLLVSGPNTGGKTVLLKAVGLISALTQSGVVPPVGPDSRLPVFGDAFADIGDEQSIEASLSTFSAHLRNLGEILDRADPESLVLIDEMGSGTDPIEGAALAKSIVVELTRRGAMTLATTHLGQLKQLAAEESGVVNASLDFDSVELRPTFRLRKGLPGRSYGLAIARRLGFPASILERADALVPEAERMLASLLEEVESKDRALTTALDEAEQANATARRLEREVQARADALEARERTAERRARQQARDMLLQARAEVEAAISELRRAAAEAKDEAERERAARLARHRVEEAASRQVRRAQSRTKARPGRSGAASELHEGDRVLVEATGATGTIVELRDGRAVVDLGGVRVRVTADGLSPAPAEARAATVPKKAGWSAPDFDAASEVDLRGLRADEAVARLQPAIDAAIQAALPSLRIIHGKGTGALREVVADLLRQDQRISRYRPGGVGEGGTGVTVAELQ